MKKIKITTLFLAAVMMAGICTGCSSKSEKKNNIFAVGKPGACGLMLRDSKEGFTIFESGSVTDVVTNEDGSVSWNATAAGGAGGGVSFYAKSSKEEINIANYKSIELEFAYEPVAGRWNAGAQNPGFCLRILPYDSTGLFGGFEDLEYFDSSGFLRIVWILFHTATSLADGDIPNPNAMILWCLTILTAGVGICCISTS